MSITRVFNLATQQEQTYTCPPDQAVIAAYAQERKDFNTWQYAARYGHMLEEGAHTWLCGDWSALKSEPTLIDTTPHPPECQCDRCFYGADLDKWINHPGEY